LAIAAPLARRRDDWLESVAVRLLELQERVEGFTVEDLADNEQFVSTVMQATAAAIRTHQGEKLEALRCAVVNSALGIPIDDAQQQMFVSFVSDFTEWHLRVLELFQDPPGWAARNGVRFPSRSMGARAHVLEDAFPQLIGHREFYDQVVRDLHSRGLFATDLLHGSLTGSGMMQSVVTETGARFLQYIHGPTIIGKDS
jgi:hypothetical protein